MKKFIALILSVLLLLGTAACSDPENEVVEGNSVRKYSYEGTHVYTAVETSDYMVQNGVCNYKIVIPDNADTYVLTAASEFTTLFLQATGIKLETVHEDAYGLEHTSSGRYISIGNTQMLYSTGLTIDRTQLTSQGLRIVTIDKTVYLIGGGSQGALYAVYDFMDIVFDFEIYSYDTWKINEGQKNVKLMNFNVTDIPDVEMRSASYGPVKDNRNSLGYRFRMPKGYSDYCMPIGDVRNGGEARTIHNTRDVVLSGPTEWFNDKQDQLCYTAHGDEEKYNQLIDRIVDVITYNMTRYPVEAFPDYNIIAFTIEDTSSSCNCAACIEAKTLYGSDAGAVIVLANDIMAKIRAWMELPENAAYYRESLKCVFFAYEAYIDCPAHWDDSQGKYVVNHPDLVMRDDVGVFFAQSQKMQYAYGVYEEANDYARANVRKWFDTASFTMMWTYAVNYHEYMTMCDDFSHFTTEGYQFYTSGNLLTWNNQGAYQNKEFNNFNGLKAFLDYKMMWDSTLDTEALTDEWFDAIYGEAASVMRELFDAEREWFYVAYDKVGRLDNYKMAVYLNNPEYWPYQMLVKWMSLCDEAQSILAKIYKENEPELYEVYKKHVDTEWCSPAYLLIARHEKASIPSDVFNKVISYFDEILPGLGTMCEGEVKGSISSTINAAKGK